MRNIDIYKHHGLGIEAARVGLRVIEKELDDRFGVWLDWRGNTAQMMGRGVTGTVAVDDERIAVNLVIAYLFLPLVGRIRSEIVDALDREFPAPNDTE